MLAATVTVVAPSAAGSAGELSEALCGYSVFRVTAGSVHVVVSGVHVTIMASVMVILDVSWVWRVRGRGVLCPGGCIGASSAAWVGSLIFVLRILGARILIRLRWINVTVAICRICWIVGPRSCMATPMDLLHGRCGGTLVSLWSSRLFNVLRTMRR